MRKIVPLLAFLVTALSAVFGVSSAYAFDPVSSPTEAMLGVPSPFSKSWGYCRDWNNNGGQHAWSFSYSGTVFASTGCPMYNQGQTPVFRVRPASYGAGALSGSFIVDWYLPAYPYDFDWHTLFVHVREDGSVKTLPVQRYGFFSGNLYVYPSGTVLSYNEIFEDVNGDLWIQHLSDVAKPTVAPSSDGMFASISFYWDNFWNPDAVAFSSPASEPVYLKFRWGSNGWTYRGDDGNVYWLRVNADKYFKSAVPETPLASFVFDGDETLFSSDTGSLGIAAYRNPSGNTLSRYSLVNFGSGNYLPYLTSVADPFVYFADQYSNVYRWDVRCKTPGFDSCRLDVSTSSFYCADSSGNRSPWNEACGLETSVGLNGSAPVGDPPSSGSGSSGSWSTGSGSSSGSGSSGSGSSGSGSYPSYPSVDQNCVPKLFSGSLVSVSTAASLDPATCAWRTANGAFRCQDSGGHACVTDGDICVSEISDPGQYSSGSTQYSGDVARYECSAGQTQCLWYSKKSCGPSASCYQDGAYCRVKPGEENPDYSSAIGDVSFSGAPVPDASLDVSNLGALGTGSVSVSGVVRGVGSFSGSAPLTALTESGFCDMFNPDGSFAYYSDGEAFAVTLSVSWIVPIGWVEENVVPHVDRFFAVFTAPVNNLGSIVRTFGTFPEGSKICVLGRVAEVRYQSSLKSLDSAKHVAGFQSGRMGFFDYVFLLVFGVVVVAWLRKAASNPS